MISLKYLSWVPLNQIIGGCLHFLILKHPGTWLAWALTNQWISMIWAACVVTEFLSLVSEETHVKLSQSVWGVVVRILYMQWQEWTGISSAEKCAFKIVCEKSELWQLKASQCSCQFGWFKVFVVAQCNAFLANSVIKEWRKVLHLQ